MLLGNSEFSGFDNQVLHLNLKNELILIQIHIHGYTLDPGEISNLKYKSPFHLLKLWL